MNRPSISACAAMALRTRIFMRFRSPLLISPNTDITRSCASFTGSIGPPTSGTQQPGTSRPVSGQRIYRAIDAVRP